MKFLHLGDLHLGKSLGEYDLRDDQEYLLNQVLELIKKEQVDAVLIAGDVYDRAIPSESATNLLDYFLRSLAELNIKVFMISGNHDSDDRLNYGSSLFESNQIYISSKYKGELFKHTTCDEYGEIDIYMLPFVKASYVRHYFPDAEIDSYDAAVRTVIDRANVDTSRRNIMIAHQFVAGKGDDPVLGGSESIGTQSVGLVEKIGYDCFDAFDYVALGHIHSSQRVGRDEVRYSGSPLKYSLSEANNSKTVPLVTMGEKGEVTIELVPIYPLHDVRHIRGTLKELLDKKNIKSPEDYIYVTLTEENIVENAIGIFREEYPNIVKIDYDNSHMKDIELFDVSKRVSNKAFPELIAEFYLQIYGREISEEEMAVMMEVAKEAKATDETN